MDLDKIKKLTLRALMSDETLMHSLVLKGGNALHLVYEITNRGSIDIDFSVEREFTEEEFNKMPSWMDYILNRTFREAGLFVFDIKFGEKPKAGSIPEWKGYFIEFKIIEKEKVIALEENPEKMRRYAIKLNEQSPKYVVDISAYEYVEGATTIEMDGVILRVYTLEMILFEKLRALCQTMPEYKEIVTTANQKHRARDIYDIHLIYNNRPLNLDPNLLIEIFAAKQVPLEFMNNLDILREYNRENWETVIASIPESDRSSLESYDYYFNQLLDIAKPFTNL
ncbi:nucleotidyl transferase AbiEii/AbiGii toxin family protein [Kaistella yonginensis]|uniref:nucleotidyl transferase AbiEii/AbiGii toxin family protein n=1 Tax=Kaistella yonginensis TaxID=658267 RepID=UPI0025B544A6|nr:nucleotidyl transferase AbiEii/AbiGii toxin family protein [Kaistella yonginensis]MDN3607190.1 nucleotidyl transferase AbiEii/AbiGii toxin family protein [Kaistella yonginensis]